MQFNGSVQGEAARKFPGFTYRRPVKLKAPGIRDLDPDRALYDQEYPRYTKLSAPNLQIVELADYSVRFSPRSDDGWVTISVWMKPNQFTQEKAERKVYEFRAINADVHRHRYCDLALEDVFRSVRRGRWA